MFALLCEISHFPLQEFLKLCKLCPTVLKLEVKSDLLIILKFVHVEHISIRAAFHVSIYRVTHSFLEFSHPNFLLNVYTQYGL